MSFCVQYQINNVQPFFIRDESLLYPQWEQTKGRWVKTSKGQVKIIFPGVRNNRSGPDYLNAILQLKTGALIQGHVEIHTKSSQWKEHHHHMDNEYQNVLLHVFKVRNSPVQPYLMEFVLSSDYMFKSVKDPCINLSLPQESLLNILECLGEIRWEQMVDKVKSSSQEELIYMLFKFIHFKGESRSIRKLSDAFVHYQMNAEKWQDIYDPIYQICQQIKWKMGGRRPSSNPCNRLAFIMNLGWNLMYHPNHLPKDLNGMIKILDSLKNWGYTVPGHAFSIEILGNIILPYLETCANGIYFKKWRQLPFPNYAVINKRVKKWNINPSLFFVHAQGILLLEKDYCSAGNCNLCPVMNCMEPCKQ